MAQKEKEAAGTPPDWSKRLDAGTQLLGVVGALVEPLAALESACARKRPGRLSSVDWIADSPGLQQVIEQQAPLLADLAAQLGRAAGEVVKLVPKQKTWEETAAEVPEPDKTRAGLARAGQSKS